MRKAKAITIANAAKWTENTYLVLGLMKLILLAAFFASFAVIGAPDANAQSEQSCDGRNMLEVLKAEKPDTYANVLETAENTLNADAIFWKVEKQGQKPSWLLGTMHLADPQIATIPEDAKQAILESDTLVIESIEALDQQAAAKAMAGLAHLTLLSSGTLSDLISDDLEDELELAVTQRGVPMALADRMQPWLIATTVSLPVCEIIRKQNGERVLDAELAEFAMNQGTDVRGLESVAEQLTAIASLPIDYHVSALEETLASGDLAVDMIETMKILYKQERMGVVFPLMKSIMPETGSGEGVAQFQEALIDKRNHIMAERVLPILNDGPTFVAVGALHLPGETGLVKLLRDAGYTVSPAR